MNFSDRPIQNATEDQLGFQPFAAMLATGLRAMAPAEGMVVALHAPWGSGKTSALNLMERHLAVLYIAEQTNRPVADIAGLAAATQQSASDKAKEWTELLSRYQDRLDITVIRFNPWYFSGQENLVKAFFGAIGSHLEATKKGGVAKAFAAVLKRADAAGTGIGASIGAGLGGPPAAAAGASIGGFFGKLVGDKFDNKESLESTLSDLRTALRDGKERLLVIIDDIDRLLPEELRQLLTLIKSLGNLPKVTYLLAFDHQQVVGLIEKAGISSSDYLEKIVQVSFELPPPEREALQAMLFARMDAIRNHKDLEDQRRWSESFIFCVDPYLKTPRDVTRLCNALQVTWPAVQDEVDWSDLVVLETLRLSEPKIYRLCHQNIDALTGSYSFFDPEKKWAEQLVPSPQNARNPDVAKAALLHLFPTLAKPWKESAYTFAQSDLQARRSRRLRVPEYTRNYFRLNPAPDQFTATSVRSLFASQTPDADFTAALKQAKERKSSKGLTMVHRLLTQITEEMTPGTGLPLQLARSILANFQTIAEIGDVERTLFSTDNDLRISWLFVEALRLTHEGQRANVVKDWLVGSAGAQFVLPFIESMTGDGAKRSGETIFAEADHEQLRSWTATQMDTFAASPGFITSWRAGRLLFCWARLTSYEHVSKWIKDKLADDAFIFSMANIIPSEVHSSSEGQYFRLDRKAWGNLLDMTAFENRLIEVGATSLSEQRSAILAKYRLASTRAE